MAQKLLLSQIETEILVCPYCMDEVSQDEIGCCGESSAHFEAAYVTTQLETYLESEVEIVDDSK